MSRKLRIQTARFKPATQPDIWARSSWVLPPERSLPVGADIGGRPTPMAATTIPTPRHTVEVIITVAMAIIMQRLTTIRPPELTAGNRLPTVLTGRLRAELLIILTPGLTPEAPAFRHLTAAEVRHRPIIRTPEPTLRPHKVRAR